MTQLIQTQKNFIVHFTILLYQECSCTALTEVHGSHAMLDEKVGPRNQWEDSEQNKTHLCVSIPSFVYLDSIIFFPSFRARK